MSGGFGLPIVNIAGPLAELGKSFGQGYDRAQAPELLRAALQAQGGGQAAPGTLGALGSPYGAPQQPALSALGEQPQARPISFASNTGPAGDYLATTRATESGGNDTAKNPTSTATGRYQFTGQTWAGLARKYPELGLTADGRTDPAQQEKAMQAFTNDNARVLTSKGIPITPGNLYVSHFLGEAGGPRFIAGAMSNPDAPASAFVDPKAVAANRSIFLNKDGSPKTAGEVYAERTSRYGGTRAPQQVASADPNAADMPAVGAQEAEFRILGQDAAQAPVAGSSGIPASAARAVGLPGAGGQARQIDPALLSRMLDNQFTAPIANQIIASQFKTGEDYAFTAVGDQFYRTNKRTGSVELVPGVSKPQTTVVAPGSTLVDQVTGRPLYSAAAKPESVAAGSRLVDPNTGREVYSAPDKPVSVAPGARLVNPNDGREVYAAPEKSATPSFVQMNGRLLLTDPDSGQARDVTPADLPQGYRPATPAERKSYGVNETTPLAIGPDGKPQSLGGQTINVNPGERAQDAAIGADYGKRFVEYQRGAGAAGSTLATITTMERAMNTPGFYSGTGGPARLAFNRGLESLGVKDKGSAAPAEVFDALSNRVILDGLGGSLGAGISNGDRDFIQRTAPDLAKTPEGNRQLLGLARSMAQRQKDVAQLARDYAKANGGRLDMGFDERLSEWAAANPLTPGGAPRAQGGQPQAGQPRQAAPQSQAAPVPAQAAPPRAPAMPQGQPAPSDLEAEARRRGLIR
ncbi:hypothetical protein AFCDBAGC_1852 [Methylobacterium cerastii]|uniref:Uncharacterized protein n=1 Tax=Methylobacterium cerastii TaxID=932741 RepID=A0ABQ4QGL8_9HYPH|nr:hypothetical protein [Methylobacterium cerastii]GJD43990.1 hypothetical protein AFCDBAGC_1852 [Methylobacterium cerastii]